MQWPQTAIAGCAKAAATGDNPTLSPFMFLSKRTRAFDSACILIWLGVSNIDSSSVQMRPRHLALPFPPPRHTSYNVYSAPVHQRQEVRGERRGLTCNVHWTPVTFFLSAQTWTANTWWNFNLGDTEPTLKSQINTFARHVYVLQTLIIFTSWCQQNKLKPQCLWRLKKLQKKPPLTLIYIIAGNVIKCWHFGGNLCILSVAIVLHKVARQS